MSEPAFSASRVKLKRARKFIVELEDAIAAYVAAKPYTAKIVQDGAEFKIQIDWTAIGNEPGAILGDAVHNMRTALDLMASELARHHSGTDKNVYFPFAESADEIDKMIDRRFKKAGPAACDLVRSLKPYVGGNVALRAIHDLDIRDKHTTVIDTPRDFQVLVTGSYEIDNPLGATVEARIENERFYFAADSALAGKDIVPTLKSLADDIESIIELFAALITPGGASTSQGTV